LYHKREIAFQEGFVEGEKKVKNIFIIKTYVDQYSGANDVDKIGALWISRRHLGEALWFKIRCVQRVYQGIQFFFVVRREPSIHPCPGNKRGSKSLGLECSPFNIFNKKNVEDYIDVEEAT
jgi:hypothetical protein